MWQSKSDTDLLVRVQMTSCTFSTATQRPCQQSLHVGETKNTLKTRFYQAPLKHQQKHRHPSHSKHFDQTDHRIHNMMCVAVEKAHSVHIIAFRHLPLNSEHRFPAPSSKLRASLSGTFLQTLPELVTPLKAGALFISAQLSTDAVSALRKVWVLIKTDKTVEART